MTDKRYHVETDKFEISLKDNITKKYPFSLVCENIDEFEPLLNEVTNVCADMNRLWEQTQRFENYNQELVQRSIKYDDAIDELKHENKYLMDVIFAMKDYAAMDDYKSIINAVNAVEQNISRGDF